MGIIIYKYGSKLLNNITKLNLEDKNGTIDYLIKSRKKKLKSLIIPDFSLDFILENENIVKLEEKFYNDINNENNLISLITECEKIFDKNEDKIMKFQYFLFKYMDVLSNKNRQKFTKVEYKSNFEKFENFINLLAQEKFEIKNNAYFLGYFDLAERDKFIYSDGFKIKQIKESFIELDKKEDMSEREKSIKKEMLINIILKNRRRSKISFTNKELLFGSILRCYYNTIIEEGDKVIKEIELITSGIKTLLDETIQEIKNDNLNDKDRAKTLIMILLLPLISNDIPSIVKLSSNYKELQEKNFSLNFEEEDNTLIIKQNNIELIRLNNKNVWNKFDLDVHFINYHINKLKEIDLLRYVKLNYFQNYNFYNYDSKIKKFNNKLTKYILQSKTMKTLFSYLHPQIRFDIDKKDQNYIFDNDDIVEEYLNSIIYVPCKLKSYGYTLKDLLLVFIEGLPPSISGNREMSILSKLSSFQILSLHEGGSHWSSAYLSFKFQDNDIKYSPKFDKTFFLKNYINIDDFKIKDYLKLDGGDIIELLLFSRQIQFFKVKEILFLLNKNSYNTDFREFNKNFISLYEKTNDLYQDACKDPELKELLNYMNITEENANKIFIQNISFNFKRNGEIERSRCPIKFNNL